ncbi:MAG: hypothetical protein SGJ18_14065 [Pseudomonadota bacterium]|nr:hypothetical protein [Pseudomonadota bacterium]
MLFLNKLNELESAISRKLCWVLFGLHDVERESWFSPYGGPNQLQSEVNECRNLIQSILKDLNFGSKTAGTLKFSEFMAKGSKTYPASLNFMDWSEEERGGSYVQPLRQTADSFK